MIINIVIDYFCQHINSNEKANKDYYNPFIDDYKPIAAFIVFGILALHSIRQSQKLATQGAGKRISEFGGAGDRFDVSNKPD